MEKRLIINADDFGWDQDATEAILTLSSAGNLSSTTILATHASDKEIQNLKKIKSVSKGVHINLIDGSPISKASEVKSLVDSEGKFYPANKLFKRFVSGRVKVGELELEIRRQIKRLSDAGIDISHADSHQHVHLYPFLGNYILPILRRNGIEKIRSIRINSVKDKRRIIIKIFSMFPNSSMKDFVHPQLLLSDFSVVKNITDQVFASAISHAFENNSLAEFMTHPGIADRKGSYLQRLAEFNFLNKGTWKEYLKDQKINLVTYDMI